LRYSGLLPLALLAIVSLTSSRAAAKFVLAETPTPSIDTEAYARLSLNLLGPVIGPIFDEPLTPGLSSSAEAFNFDDNPPVNGGYLFIPPDPYCAAGPEHVLNVGNVYIEWRVKNPLVVAPQAKMSLETLFAGTPGMLPPTVPTNMFDPKCIYDQYNERFIVVILQRVTSPALDSRILIAVSKTSDPNAGWWRHSINSLLIIGGVARWADYPGLGVDDDALYVTNNMFSAAGAFGGSRLWIIQKAGAYAGPDGNISQAVYDYYGATGNSTLSTTSMPAHMYGPSPAASTGTFVVATGYTDGTNEAVAVTRVDDPTGVVSFNFQILSVGNTTANPAAVPAASQLGTGRTIATIPLRCMNAVWRNSNLYAANTLRPDGGVDGTQATAHWYRLDTTNLAALAVADQGDIGGEDLGVGTHTWIPQVMVDQCDNMAVGFAASNTGIYAGAYFALRLASDPAGTIGNSSALALGTDYYIRTFSSSMTAASRWGDYSGLALCPVDEATFWVYNEYACTRGTPTTVGGVTEDGRWCTRVGSFVICQPVSAVISFFDARPSEGGVTLRAEFRSNLGVEAVNVYRGVGDGDVRLIETVYGGGESFAYVDRTARPGETYTYQIGVRDPDGEFLSPTVKVTVAGLGVALDQNVPNPFNPTTTISFTLPQRELVTLSIYDAAGTLVRTLVNEVRGYGKNEVTWDGRDNAGATVGSGVYFYRLTAGKFSESKKMVMLK
jgi:hypothetical protein